MSHIFGHIYSRYFIVKGEKKFVEQESMNCLYYAQVHENIYMASAFVIFLLFLYCFMLYFCFRFDMFCYSYLLFITIFVIYFICFSYTDVSAKRLSRFKGT